MSETSKYLKKLIKQIKAETTETLHIEMNSKVEDTIFITAYIVKHEDLGYPSTIKAILKNFSFIQSNRYNAFKKDTFTYYEEVCYEYRLLPNIKQHIMRTTYLKQLI